jgi:Holliday junction DNA helicase RuvB
MHDKKSEFLRNTENEQGRVNLRPLMFDDYIGQEKIKKQLKVFIEAAKIKKKPLPHTLLFGPPGLGKTTIAEILANELGKKIVFTSAPAIEKGGDLASLIMELKNGDILFIDEIHALKKVFEELMYPAMEDFSLDITVGGNGESKIMRIPTAEFTLIGATTRPGLLSNPFRDRFTITQGLEYYTISELELIIARSASLLSLKIENKATSEIANRSRGTARVANNLLKMVGDYAIVKNKGLINYDVAKEALDDFDIDDIGLDVIDRKILHAMLYVYKNKPVGVKNLATYVGEDKETVESMVEPYLMQMGLLARTDRGKMLTDLGISYVNEKLSSDTF